MRDDKRASMGVMTRTRNGEGEDEDQDEVEDNFVDTIDLPVAKSEQEKDSSQEGIFCDSGEGKTGWQLLFTEVRSRHGELTSREWSRRRTRVSSEDDAARMLFECKTAGGVGTL
eukprot:189861-Hanusia_phi.AAC.2